MTKHQNEGKGPHENTGNETTVHNPKAPGHVEKVDPQTGETQAEGTDPKSAA